MDELELEASIVHKEEEVVGFLITLEREGF